MRLFPHSCVGLLRRYAWLGLALPCVYVGAASLAFVIRQRHANTTQAAFRLPVSPAPVAATRLMVFAPHCDDETLGCAGLIQQTIAARGHAQVVLMTNGDGFRAAVECQTHSLHIGPQDYIEYAAVRQQESLRALANLGVTSENVRFLGYPDQGLQTLWNDHWMPNHLYTSATTRCDHAPYATVFHKETAYCGRNVIEDVKATLRAFHPTLVTVTHPAEDHADHAATAAFVARALQELQDDPREASWARQARLEYYLVHRGDWPLPQTTNLSLPLVPPVELAQTDTRWMCRPLTPEQTQLKARSIACYPSQTAMMGRFLNAFARSTELFGEITPAPLPVVPDNSMRVDAKTDDWQALTPCLLDPIRDNVLRDLQGAGDIRALYACRDSRFLYVRLDCRQPVSRRLRYTLHLRAFAPDGDTPEHAYIVRLRPSNSLLTLPDGVLLASHNRTLEAAIPLENLVAGKREDGRRKTEDGMEKRKAGREDKETGRQGEKGGKTQPSALCLPRVLAVSAETWGGIEIDKTGVRFLVVTSG